MGWLDANEYLLMEVAGRDRVDEVARTVHLAYPAGDRHHGSEVTPCERRKQAPRFVGRLMCFLLSPG